MYKVVVVEDEAIIRNGLIKMIDWEALDCRVVGEASNGEEALKVIASLKPDILILDINMPILDGLEVLERLPRDVFTTIIISGHSEFSYAQKAISFDVSEYLLKPLELETVTRALGRAKEKIATKRGDHSDIADPYRILQDNLHSSSVTLMKAVSYIEEYFSDKITMDDLVQVTEKSHASINKRFQRDFGMTFNDYLTRFRIQKAIEYIQTLDFQLYEIAAMVGFTDYKYFNRVFKRTVGETPKLVQLYYMRNNEGSTST